MSLVKRIVKVAVCAVLLIVAVCMNTKTQALAGAGKGTNEKITTLEAFSALIKETGRKQSTARSAPVVESATGKSYDSFTFIETTSLRSQSDSSQNGDNGSWSSSSSNSSLNRTLEMYYTEDAVWYKAEGRLVSKSDSSSRAYSSSGFLSATTETNTKRSMNFKIQIYAEEEKVLLYIENLQYSYSYKYYDGKNSENNKTETEDGQDLDVLKNYYNRWIDCTSMPYIANVFLTVNDTNMATLSRIGNLLETAWEAKEYTESNNAYQLKTPVARQIFGLSNGDDVDFDGTVSVDLSRPAVPSLLIDASAKNKIVRLGSGYNYSYSGSSYVYLNDNIQFRNINNTVFKKANMKAIDISEIIGEEN